jgi:hypothetical protein
MLAAPQLNGDVRLHIAANIRRVAVVFGLIEVFMGNVPHSHLERINFWKNHWQMEGAKKLAQTSHDKNVGRRATRVCCAVQFRKPLAEKVGSFAVAAAYQALLGLLIAHRLLFIN